MNPPREPRIAGLLALPFALLFMNGAIAAERVPLDRVVEALQADGTVVVYSAALVDSGLELELTDLTPEAIDVALRPLRLTLVREGNYWLIAPLPDLPAVRLRLRSHSGAPIHSATLTTSEGVVTVGVDPEGFIDRQVARGTAVEVHTDGHWPLLATLSEPDQLLTLEPRLEPETVIVTGSQQHLPVGVRSGTAATVTADDLEARPALGGDSIRILTELPGMSSVGVSASPIVRGGLPDETLLRIDGVELIEPFHLADFQSLFSAVDDRTVASIDVYTGGFPARYGHRMSGVMEMSTAERPRTERTEIGLSMFALMANARGVSDDGAGWWLASARRGNLDLMIDRINSRAGSPKYWDAYGSVGRRLSDELEAAFGVLLSNDDVVFRDDAERARSAIDDRYAWMRLDAESGNLRGRTIIAIADSDRQKDQFSPDDEEDSAGFLDYSRDTSRVSAQSDWSLHRGATLVEFGGSIEYADADYDASGLVNRGDMGELLGRPATEAIDIRTRVDGPTWGVYGSVDLPVTEHVSVQPGIRLDAQGYDSRGEKVYVSPRFGVEWLLDDAMTLRLAAGRFLQPEAPWELPVTDGVRAFDTVQRANHYVLALEWARDGWTLRADAYRKDYENPRRRFENIFDPFVILPELEPDRIAIAPDRARAQGVDLEARRAFGNGWIAGITLSDLDAEDRIEGTWVPRRWSQHHTARVLAAWKGERTQFAIAATWHSGWRTAALPSSADEPFVIAEILNNDELKDYVALDLRLARTHRIGRAELTLYADLSNVLNRDNAAGVDYDVEEIDDGFAFVPDAETLLPFIPSLGFRLSF